jgi:salicylate hydroxylase
MDTSPIIVAGGGIAGLAAALALGAHNTLILEQAPAFTTAGAGVQIGPNAVRALQKLGAWDAVEPLTSKPREIQFRDGVSGTLIKRLPLGLDFLTRYGANYHVAHRAGLHAGLLEVVRSKPNLKLELGQVLQHVELGANDVQVRVKGQSRRAPALIATDGVQSQLRQALFPGTAAIKSGATFHRALLPLPSKSSLALECVTVWMMPGGHVVQYGVGNPQLLNMVAVTPEGMAPQNFFNRVTPALADLIEYAASQFTHWPALYVQPLTKWTFGNTLLLGDAAHGTLPYMAQGAAMALEDAACLAHAVSSAHSLRHAFAETAKRRIPRTFQLHSETIRTGKIYHASGILRQVRNVGLNLSPNSLMHLKLKWLYNAA